MDQEAQTTSWIVLLEMRDRLIAQLHHDVPAVWPSLIGRFLNEVKAVPHLPSGVLLLLLVDLARELDRFAAGTATTLRRQSLLAALEADAAATPVTEAVCCRFEEAIRRWCARIEPGSLISEVQAQRVAEYIDQHFAEPITLGSLSRASGWCTRQLSRAFRSSMRMSTREYLQATRIDHAAARLRQGDKVESVLAAVGWRGRKNFFDQFRQRLGTTPAQYRDSWMNAPSADVVSMKSSDLRRPEERLAVYRARRHRTDQVDFQRPDDVMRQARLAGAVADARPHAASMMTRIRHPDGTPRGLTGHAPRPGSQAQAARID